MSDPTLDPAIEPTANIRGRIRWATDAARAGRYDGAALPELAIEALALALAAGLADEHRILAELTAARADGNHALVSKLAGELSNRIALWGVAASEALWRADRAALYGSERSPR